VQRERERERENRNYTRLFLYFDRRICKKKMFMDGDRYLTKRRKGNYAGDRAKEKEKNEKLKEKENREKRLKVKKELNREI